MAQIDSRLWALIQHYSRQLNLDPRAVAAVSIMEGGGRFGAVGDAGTSYGPFQLHVGGALPPGKNAAWANSPAGVLYAMQHMATVAAGLHGARAISNIVRRFERPAQPAPEIQGAIARYGTLHGGHLPAGGMGATGGTGGGRGIGAALAMLAQIQQPHINAVPGFQGPADILNHIVGGSQTADAFQPVQPVQPQPSFSAQNLAQGLDETRQRLLRSFG